MLPGIINSEVDVPANATAKVETPPPPQDFWISSVYTTPPQGAARPSTTLTLPDQPPVNLQLFSYYPQPWQHIWLSDGYLKAVRSQPRIQGGGIMPLLATVPANTPIPWSATDTTGLGGTARLVLFGWYLAPGESPPQDNVWQFPTLPSMQTVKNSLQQTGQGSNTPDATTDAAPPPINPLSPYNLTNPTGGLSLLNFGEDLYPTRLGQPSVNIPPFQRAGASAPVLPTTLATLTGQSYRAARFIRSSQTGRLHSGPNFINRKTGRIHQTDATTTLLNFYPPAERLELQSDYGSAKVQFINAAEANAGIDITTVDPIYIGPGETYELNFDCVATLVQADDRNPAATPFALNYRAYY